MAPEQIEHSSEVDHRADIYSLGVVFYEMLTGELPIGRFAAPSEKSGVGSDVDDIVFRSLEKEPGRRQQSASEVRTEIFGVLPLTDVPHSGFGGVSAAAAAAQSDDSKNRPELALTLTFFGIIFPIVLLFASVAIASQGKMFAEVRVQSERIVVLRTNQLTNDLKNEIASAEKRGETIREIEKLKGNLATAQKQFERLMNRRSDNVVEDELKFLPLLISAFVLLPLCAIPGTIFGWRQLRRQRILGLKSGRTALIISAWFWPMLIVISLVFLLILLPALQGPGWVAGAGLSLGIIVSIVAGIWLIRRTLKWLKTVASATDRSQLVELEKKRSSKRPLKQRRLLYGFTLASFGSLTLLIIFGVVSLYIYRVRGGRSDSALISSIIVVGIVLGIFSIAYYLLINLTYLPKKAPPHPNYNPWPKRVFWLVLAIFVGPSLLVGIGLLMPALARTGVDPIKSIRGEHAVTVRSIMSEEKRQLVQFEFINNTSEIIRAEVSFRGTPLTEGSDFPDGLSPGDTEIIQIMPGKNEIGIAFNLPDSTTSKIAASELQLLLQQRSGKLTFYEDLEVLPLFRVEAKPFNYSAEIHFSPPGESFDR